VPWPLPLAGKDLLAPEFGNAGRELYVDVGCSACHGGRGEGRVGPGLAGVIETFSTCAALSSG